MVLGEGGRGFSVYLLNFYSQMRESATLVGGCCICVSLCVYVNDIEVHT